ncbi:MAG TPA: phosphoribosylamine--glycine ligase [Firmicutes bacterium]|nr:phosphoribosylamine--glycine ligase [Bacillota bacterium]
MKILIVGGGGREHTIGWKLHKEGNTRIYACPGNGGLEEIGECHKIKDTDIDAILEFAKNEKIDLTVVGPEKPLSLGIVDIFEKNKLKIFGPSKKASILESSKCFAKEFMKKYGIPTAEFFLSDNLSESIKFIENKKPPYVIKFDGLAAGKGVKVINSFEEGKNYLIDIFENNIFNSDSPKVVIEEYLSGVEISYFIFTDGKDYIPTVPAQDYKRIFEGDKGPNTGGMGSYSTPLFFNDDLNEKIEKEIVERTLKGLEREGIDYRGVLYFGLMVTKKGVFVLEYNVRFGDPETQVILPRMKTSLIELIESVIEGDLRKVKVEWSDDKAICVILASRGYPLKYETGKEITGIDKVKDVILFHAGTKRVNGKLLTSGGRVIGIVGIDRNIEKAREKVYKAAELIEFEGKYYRKDIPRLNLQI